jgi:ketosteroid isomerase-like protein
MHQKSDPSRAWCSEFFRSIDAKDAQKFAHFFLEDGSFKFANYPAATGRVSISQAANAVFDHLVSLRHEILRTWQSDQTLLVEGRVFYLRKDQKEFSFDFFSRFDFSGAAFDSPIKDYRAFVDVHELFMA